VGQQPPAIGVEAWPSIADLIHPIGIEQGRCRRAIGEGEAVARGPFAVRQIRFEPIIRDPQGVAPGNGMPNLGVSERDARNMAAYLYTLQPKLPPD